MSRTTPLLLALAGFTALSLGQTPIRRPVGFALGDGSYLVNSDAIRGDSVLLEGEALSTNVAPARLYLDGGGFGIVGVGSQVRVFADRVAVSGVSFEMLRYSSPALPVEAGGLLISPATPDARLSVFTDRPAVISVMVSKGEIAVSSKDGRLLRRMPAGSAATFARGPGEIRIQEKRAALEIARICMRQLELLGILEEYVPDLAPRRKAMVDLLAEASGDLLAPRQQQRDLINTHDIPTGLPAINPEKLITAVREVHFRLNQEGLDEAGCGDPECAAAEPPRWRNRFFGWAGGFELPPPGCVLCQPGETPEPVPAPDLPEEP